MPFTASPPPSTWTLDNGYISAAAVKREATLPPAATVFDTPPPPLATAPHVIIPHLTPSDIRDFLSQALGLAADGVEAARAGVDALRALQETLADGVAELAAARAELAELVGRRGRAGVGARRRAGAGARGRSGLGVRTRAQARRGGW